MGSSIFHPEVQAKVDALSTPASLQTIFGTMPASKKVAKIWKKGFKLPPGSEIFAHKSWYDTKKKIEDFAENFLEFERTGTWPMRHKEVNDDLEGMHGAVHVACNQPMSKLDMAVYAVVFWLHHCNVDRLWESYLSAREKIDGSRAPVAAEFESDSPNTYKTHLAPFTRKNAKTLSQENWISSMTFNLGTFNAKYDKLLDPHHYASEAYKARMVAREATRREANMTGAVVLAEEPVKKMAMITFSKPGVPCTLTLYEESFYMHFFVHKKGESFTYPLTAGELKGRKDYMGLGTHFGGMEPGEPYHAAVVETMFPFEGAIDDYEVKYMFEHDENDEVEKDDHPLLKNPGFWTSTIGCANGQVPKDDMSWINFAYVPED
jgi:hypothetical protein